MSTDKYHFKAFVIK